MAEELTAELSVFSENLLKQIFKVKSGNPTIIVSRENHRLEFRETFGINACKDKLRTFAAFANNQGGYLLFGVKDRPRQLLGLSNDNFSNLETERLTGLLNEHFSPEISWHPHEYEFKEKLFGLIYIEESRNKPVVCIRNLDQAKCKEGEIYYRYRGRSEPIKYPELKHLLDELRRQEHELWLKHISRIAKAGVQNAAILDSITGEVTGASGTFLIDESLLPKISFIREGHFTENRGAPALKIVGDAQVIDSHLIQPTKQIVRRTRGINFPDIVASFLDQENVSDPREYISAICYQTTAYLPLYYYMQQGNLSVQDVQMLIKDSKSTSGAKTFLLRRLEGSDSLALPATKAEMYVADGSTIDYRGRLMSQNLEGKQTTEAIRCILRGIRSLDFDDVNKAYLLPIMKSWFEQLYWSADAKLRDEFRRAICHLDSVLFKHEVIKEKVEVDDTNGH